MGFLQVAVGTFFPWDEHKSIAIQNVLKFFGIFLIPIGLVMLVLKIYLFALFVVTIPVAWVVCMALAVIFLTINTICVVFLQRREFGHIKFKPGLRDFEGMAALGTLFWLVNIVYVILCIVPIVNVVSTCLFGCICALFFLVAVISSCIGGTQD